VHFVPQGQDNSLGRRSLKALAGAFRMAEAALIG
jgi:hypothetical protein